MGLGEPEGASLVGDDGRLDRTAAAPSSVLRERAGCFDDAEAAEKKFVLPAARSGAQVRGTSE